MILIYSYQMRIIRSCKFSLVKRGTFLIIYEELWFFLVQYRFSVWVHVFKILKASHPVAFLLNSICKSQLLDVKCLLPHKVTGTVAWDRLIVVISRARFYCTTYGICFVPLRAIENCLLILWQCDWIVPTITASIFSWVLMNTIKLTINLISSNTWTFYKVGHKQL